MNIKKILSTIMPLTKQRMEVRGPVPPTLIDVKVEGVIPPEFGKPVDQATRIIPPTVSHEPIIIAEDIVHSGLTLINGRADGPIPPTLTQETGAIDLLKNIKGKADKDFGVIPPEFKDPE
jgi:hypothetical protein